MAFVLTIGLVIVLVGIRLLFPPVPMLASLMHRWRTSTSLLLCSMAALAAAVLIVAFKR
jgi:hypothetical protein